MYHKNGPNSVTRMVFFSVMLPPRRELLIQEETCKSCWCRFAAQNSQGWVDVLGTAHEGKLIQSLQDDLNRCFAAIHMSKLKM